MAQYRFEASVLNRANGQSAIAAAAYQSGEKLIDHATGETKRYRREEEILFAGIFAPKDAPGWAREREALWNRYEAHDARANASLARKFFLNLPHELTLEQNRYLLQDWIKENIVRRGHAADAAIHSAPEDGDARNIHAHVLMTMLPLDENGFTGRKERLTPTQRKAQLSAWRQSWAELGARHLARHGFELEAARWREGWKTHEGQREAAEGRGDSAWAARLGQPKGRHRGPVETALQRKGKLRNPSREQDFAAGKAQRRARQAQIDALMQELETLRLTAAEIERMENARPLPVDPAEAARMHQGDLQPDRSPDPSPDRGLRR